MSGVAKIFESFKEKTVLIIGDVMIDAYIFGNKKAPSDLSIPTVNASRKENRLGGAANVALNVHALGATPILCSVVGDDHDGRTFERLLNFQGMPNKGIIRSQNRITTNKLRVLAGSQQLLQVDTEDDHPLMDLDKKALMNHISNLIKESDLVIFEDYDKGTIHAEVITETIKLAKEKNIPIVVDPKSHNLLAYKGVDLIKPGLPELESFNAGKIDSKRATGLSAAIEKLHEGVGAKNYIIPLENGDIYYQTSQTNVEPAIYPSYNKGVLDLAGVGNAVIAIAGLALCMGMEAEEIAELSNIVASQVAQYSGVAAIHKDQLMKEVSQSSILKKYL